MESRGVGNEFSKHVGRTAHCPVLYSESDGPSSIIAQISTTHYVMDSNRRSCGAQTFSDRDILNRSVTDISLNVKAIYLYGISILYTLDELKTVKHITQNKPDLKNRAKKST